MNAIGYVRCSTQEQSDSGLGLDAQRERIRAYAALKGLVLVDIIEDAAVWGGKPLASRDGGRRLLDALRQRRADSVVMLKLDRGFRNAGDCLTTVEQWERKGIALHVADLGGKAVAVPIGTIQIDILEAQNASCAEEINIVIFDTNPVAVEDVRTGGSDANFSDFPVAAEDAALSDGTLEVVDTQIDPEPYGLGVRKTSSELKTALADALQAIIDNGIYAGILADWGLEAVALQ